MNISRLALAGDGVWPQLTANELSPHANVFHGRPRSGKSTLAQLVAHVLYGKSDSPWRREFAQTTPLVEGSLSINAQRGRYVLRRHRDGSPAGRLTVAAEQGQAVDSQTVPHLLGNASPRLLGQLYAVDFAEGPRVEELFAAEFARDFNALLHADEARPAFPKFQVAHADAGAARVGSRQLDALVQRRDRLTEQLETQLAGRRRHSGDLQRQLAQLEETLGERRARREQLAGELARLQAELVGLTTRLRYFTLEAAARRTAPGSDDKLQAEIEQLDAEVSRCRQTLADLQQREAVVRRDLAASQPSGAASGIDSLADQRATLAVIERLLDDLDAETAQLARGVQSDVSHDADAHARLSPVADLLRQQAYALCGQITEQERAFRRMHLQAEARQISRAQTGLSEQLEQLLAQRQSLLHRVRLKTQPTMLVPDAPVEDHCRCEHHGQFLVDSDAVIRGRGDRVRGQEEARRDVDELQRRIELLRGEIAVADDEIAAGQNQWNQWQRSRAGLVDAGEVERIKTELQELESQIAWELSCGCERPAAPIVEGWRASDVLAKLTDGRLVQIRGQQGDDGGEVIDRDGRRRAFEQLTPAERDQAYLAVTLALVASHHAQGTHLPLVLDEPFLRQDAASAAAMAGVLAGFAAGGRQLLLFTEDRDAVRGFGALGVDLFAIEELRQRNSKTVDEVVEPVVEEVATTRIVREAVDETGPQLRVTGSWPAVEADQAVCYLTEAAGMAEFPVLGDETAGRFATLKIRTVGELLAADPADVARELDHSTVTAAVVALWQAHMRLMCFVPGVTLDDAQLLAACGVDTPHRLAEIKLDDLLIRVEEFLASSRGARFAAARDRYSRARFRAWRNAARSESNRWRSSRAFSAWDSYRSSGPRIRQFDGDRTRQSRPSRRSERASRSGSGESRRRRRSERSNVRRESRTKRTTRPLRFFLETTSPVVDAPSIGPRTAEILAGVGIRSVADLLACNPASVADELADRRITGEKIAAWQQQARLVCRVPELRGYGAQLLVACGYAEPERIAGADADALTSEIASYCETKEGQRILRNSPPPTVDKIAKWIDCAGQHRSLDAA